MIALEKINYQEALRYLGDKNVAMNSTMEGLLAECEKEVLAAVKPAYLYKKIQIEDSGLIQGESVKKHLENCSNAVVLCATVGAEVDRLIRLTQVTDMAKAVVIDAMASVAVEQLCNKIDEEISGKFSPCYTTWRFSPGYGDYPISLQKKFLMLLEAQKKIGLCTNDSFLLTPSKSVTAIIGLSDKPIEKKRSSCANCNLVKTCRFRKAGTRCEF